MRPRGPRRRSGGGRAPDEKSACRRATLPVGSSATSVLVGERQHAAPARTAGAIRCRAIPRRRPPGRCAGGSRRRPLANRIARRGKRRGAPRRPAPARRRPAEGGAVTPPPPAPGRRAGAMRPGGRAPGAPWRTRRGRRPYAPRAGSGHGRGRRGRCGRAARRAGAGRPESRCASWCSRRALSCALQVRPVPASRAVWRSRAARMRGRTAAVGGALWVRSAVADGRATVTEMSMRSSSGPLRRRR